MNINDIIWIIRVVNKFQLDLKKIRVISENNIDIKVLSIINY